MLDEGLVGMKKRTPHNSEPDTVSIPSTKQPTHFVRPET